MDNLIYLKEVDSTNNYLKLRYKELPDGTAVTAELQTAGRGRRGHDWSGDSGMMPMSVLLKDPPEYTTLTARVGLAVCEAIEAMYEKPPKIGIKWPNDVIVSDRKVCGILCESLFFGDSVDAICGIGVNISQNEDFFRRADLPNAASLLMLTGASPDRDALFREIAGAVIKRAAVPFAECYGDYKARLLNLGNKVKILSAGGERAALAEDVAKNGFLICRDENGIFEVSSGEVSVRGTEGYL